MIKVTNLYKSFNNHQVLNGADIEIIDGEVITIIGGSGEGKTVLLRHMLGLAHPDSGSVMVDGKEITTLSDQDLNREQLKFGYLFQGAALFDSLTARENVAFGLRNMHIPEQKIKEKVQWCLSHVGLGQINESVKPAELSGGMKKRVGLARAIARDPKYMLYDEPTTGLDPITADTINDLIIHLNKTLRITSVVVTHDMQSAYKVSHRVAVLYKGKIIKIGTPDDIKNSDNEFIKRFIAGYDFSNKI